MQHPRPWTVHAYRADHVKQEIVPWNGLDRRASGFEVRDAAGEVIEAGFRSRRDATAWALINVAKVA